MKKLLLLLISLPLVSSKVCCQTSFSLTPHDVFASKPASNFTMYNYAVFENLTTDTLKMRWVKTQTIVTQKGGQTSSNLGDWDISVQDATNFYSPANTLDSADFILPPVLGSDNDKFIMQLYPNGTEGSLKVSFKIFVINNPSDSVTVHFNYTVTTPVTGTAAPEYELPVLEIQPNPAAGFIILKNRSATKVWVELQNMAGILLESFFVGGNSGKTIACSHLPAGTYIFMVKNGGKKQALRWVKI